MPGPGLMGALRLAVILALLLSVLPGRAGSQPTAGGPAPVAAAAAGEAIALLPFVDATGVVSEPLRYSQVVRALGAPPQALAAAGAGSLVAEFAYPALGLSFVVLRQQVAAADPPVQAMRVRSPARARTPTGLQPGLSRQQAMALVREHYRIESRVDNATGAPLRPSAGSEGPPLAAGSEWLRVTAQLGRSRQGLTLVFEQEQLAEIRFQTQPQPLLDRRERRFVGTLAALAVLGLLGYAWMRRVHPRLARAQRPGAQARAPYAWGVAALLLAALLVALALPGLQGPATATGGAAQGLGVLALLVAAALVLLGAATLMRAPRRWVGVSAGTVAVVLLVVLGWY